MIYHYCMNDSENKLIPASTVLIIRDGKIGLEVFMVVRHHEIDFASGALVFPGGKVDKNDYELFSLKITDSLYKKDIGKFLETLSSHFI